MLLWRCWMLSCSIRVFRGFDQDLDGCVNYHEFCDFLLHGKSRRPRLPDEMPSKQAWPDMQGRRGSRLRHSGGTGRWAAVCAAVRDGHARGICDGENSDEAGEGETDGSDSGGSGDDERGEDRDGGSSQSSAGGLFERAPDPLMEVVRRAMNAFAPSKDRRQRVRNFLRSKDKNASGKVRRFLDLGIGVRLEGCRGRSLCLIGVLNTALD